MDKPYDEATIQHQFDTLIKNVLKHEAKSYQRELQKRAEQDMKLQELFWNAFPVQTDHYKCECCCFQIDHHKIYVEDDLLGEAIRHLTKKQQIALLLFYFESMSDEEIAEELHINRSTVFRHRKEALKNIRMFMEKSRYAKS